MPAALDPHPVAHVALLALLTELAPDVIEIESVVTPGRRERRRQLPVTYPREHGGAADAQLPRYLTRGQQPHAPTVVGAGQRCWAQAAIIGAYSELRVFSI